MNYQILQIVELYKKEPKHLVPLVVLVITIVILFFGLPDVVLYAKDGILKWLPFLLIFGFIPWLIWKTLNPLKISKDYITAVYCVAMVVLAISFGIWSGDQSKEDLKLNGELTKGVIYKKWYSIKKSGNSLLVGCNFKYKQKEYSTFAQEDVYNQYQVGDSLVIKFSKRFPENNKILGLKRKRKTK